MGSGKLPEEFLKEMEKLLGDEYPEFLSSYDIPRRNGLRLNRRRISPEEFEQIAPFPVERIPWTDNGFYVDWRDMPARHPYYRAGLYYLQEPSAMAPAQILPVEAGDRVLDLCAAPGGKATELGARLSMEAAHSCEMDPAVSQTEEAIADTEEQGNIPRKGMIPGTETGAGILVANEISASRAKALLHNIEVFGIPNVLVTNETPARLAERFPEYFDKVLVDAPCSGEGMFRKDPDMAAAWYPEKVHECAAVQKEIILQASDMLRPGGYMVYSTCTFAPAENELVLLHLLENREEMELARISCTDGRENFNPAFSIEKLQECGYLKLMQNNRDENRSTMIDLTKAVRIWPHRAGGEGHFVALLRKRETTASPGAPAEPDWKMSAAKQPGQYRSAEHPDDRDRRKGKKKRANRGNEAGSASGGLSKEEKGYLTEFLERFLQNIDIDTDRLENHNGKIYLTPEGFSGFRGLTFLRNGLYLGELKKNRFEPAQELAMALCSEGCRISFSPEDERMAQYLRGETVRVEDGKQNGWYLVCTDGYPLGWGKLTGGVLKNKLLPGWRN